MLWITRRSCVRVQGIFERTTGDEEPRRTACFRMIARSIQDVALGFGFSPFNSLSRGSLANIVNSQLCLRIVVGVTCCVVESLGGRRRLAVDVPGCVPVASFTFPIDGVNCKTNLMLCSVGELQAGGRGDAAVSSRHRDGARMSRRLRAYRTGRRDVVRLLAVPDACGRRHRHQRPSPGLAFVFMRRTSK